MCSGMFWVSAQKDCMFVCAGEKVRKPVCVCVFYRKVIVRLLSWQGDGSVIPPHERSCLRAPETRHTPSSPVPPALSQETLITHCALECVGTDCQLNKKMKWQYPIKNIINTSFDYSFDRIYF